MDNLLIQPRDPMIARDARPFSADPGGRAVTLNWPYPSTISGALRTFIGNTATPPFNWNGNGPQLARQILTRGPFLMRHMRDAWHWYLPAPLDTVQFRDNGSSTITVAPLRPSNLRKEQGCDLPPGIAAVLQLESSAPEGKPVEGQLYWSRDALLDHLVTPGQLTSLVTPRWMDATALVPHDSRVHVGIDRATGTSEAGRLFSTRGLAFDDATAMLCQVGNLPDAHTWTPASGSMPVGGERRIATIRPAPDAAALPLGYDPRLDALAGSQPYIRLYLATPAIFSDGWKPGWLSLETDAQQNKTLQGTPPGFEPATFKLRLEAAAVGRRVAISGWNLERGKRGPKANHYAVPAGSVYFFTIVQGTLTNDIIGKLWLASICDRDDHQQDGFGLVLPGMWTATTEGEEHV